jgi:hypothetical protein
MTTLSHSDRRVHLRRPRRDYFDDGDPRRLPPAWAPPPDALWAFPDGFEASFSELLDEAQAAYHLAGARTQKLIRAARKYFEERAVIPPLTDHETTLLIAIADKGADIRADELKPLVLEFLAAMDHRGLTYEQRVEKHIAWLAQRMKAAV